MNNFLIGGVERLFLDLISGMCSSYDIQIISILGSGPLEPEFRKLPINIIHAGPKFLSSRKLPFKLFWIILAPMIFLRIVCILFKSKPDIVITSLLQSDVLGIFAATLCGVRRRILIQHDIQKFKWFIKKAKQIFALKLTTQIIANSQTTKNFLEAYFSVENYKIVVIENGIDFALMEEGKMETDSSRLVLGALGRLEAVKGHVYFFEALKILKEKYMLEPEVLIGGDGSQKAQLEDYKNIYRLKNINFMGFIKDVPKFLRLVDVLVVPSIEEGFGLVALEGLAAEKVIIASDIAAFRELIQEGQGILCNVEEAEKFASYIYTLMTEEKVFQTYKEKVKKWKEKSSSLYDIHRLSDRYKKIFNFS